MVDLRVLPLGSSSREFLNFVDVLYQGTPSYVRPLDMELSARLDPKKNPFFEHGEGVMLLAKRGGRVVGRMTAQLDREHLARYQDATGFFGFFDTTDDQEVATALLREGERWLRARGMKRAIGPLSLSINEEFGCLVEGFDTPPYLMMPHHHPYQGGLIEGAGYTKAKDVFAWRYKTGPLNSRVKKAMADVLAMPEVTVRPVSKKRLEDDVKIVVDLFNDAWGDNWGFVPFTRSEVKKMAEDFQLLLEPELTRLVFVEGEPAAMAIAIPNLNEAARDLKGSLFPTGFAKLLWRLKVEGTKSARLALLGIRKKVRTQRKYAGLALYLYGAMNEAGRTLGIQEGELSWTLEDNGAVNAGIRMMGAELYKRYRVYERAL